MNTTLIQLKRDGDYTHNHVAMILSQVSGTYTIYTCSGANESLNPLKSIHLYSPSKLILEEDNWSKTAWVTPYYIKTNNTDQKKKNCIFLFSCGKTLLK